MNKLGRISIDYNLLKIVKEYFSLITIGIIILGYLSFYSYAARYSLLYVSPSITYIAGLGIFCMLLIFLLYIVGKNRTIYRGIRVLLLIYFFFLLSSNLLLFLGVFYGIGLIYFKKTFIKTSSFKKLRLLYSTFNKKDRISRIIISTGFFVIAIFFSLKLFVIFIFLDSFIEEFQRAIYYRARILNLFVLILLLPIFMFGYFIENSNYTMFGMSEQPISILTKDSSKIQAILVFKDDKNLYLLDSSFVLEGNSIDLNSFNSFVVNNENVLSYKTIHKKIKVNQNLSLIDIYKEIK